MTGPRDCADRLMYVIDERVAPPMEGSYALAVLEELQGDIEARIDALREEGYGR